MGNDFALEILARGGYGHRHLGIVVKTYRFWRDPFFVGGCVLYGVNRWLVKPHVHSLFLRGYFNDVLLIPCALPVVLWLQRRLGLRTLDTPPTPGEIVFHLVVWSLLFEVVGPHLMRVTGDPLDVLAYTVGGALAGVWWHRLKREALRSDEL